MQPVGSDILQGHVLDRLRDLPAESVHCVVTSPCYFGLRSYKIEPVAWPDGWVGHLGMEKSVEDYIEHLAAVFHEVRRVLHPTGVVFVNLGDSYAGSGGPGGDFRDGKGGDDYLRPYNRNGPGLKPLDLCLVPERFALAMQADDWWVRDRIAFCKTSAMPESVAGWSWQRCKVKVGTGHPTDTGTWAKGLAEGMIAGGGRVPEWQDCPGCPKCEANGGYVLRRGSFRTTRAWEYIFMFTKSAEYAAFGEQVKEVAQTAGKICGFRGYQALGAGCKPTGNQIPERGQSYVCLAFRNPRSWWVIGPEPANWDFCLACGTWYGKGGWNRKAVKRWTTKGVDEDGGEKTVAHTRCGNCKAVDDFVNHYAAYPTELAKRCIQAATSDKGCCPKCGSQWAPVVEREPGRIRGGEYQTETRGHQPEKCVREDGVSRVLAYRPTCQCPPADPIPAVVCDPFMGTGSTLLAAARLGRSAIGIELSAQYVALSQARLAADAPMLATLPRSAEVAHGALDAGTQVRLLVGQPGLDNTPLTP